jgi:peptide/nickel transport system substrate-binding protein
MNMAAWFSVAFATTFIVACAGPRAAESPAGAGATESAPKKRLVAAVHGDPVGLHQLLTQRVGSGRVPGLTEIHQLVNSAPNYLDDQDVLQPHLADAVPTVENRLWKLLPEGRMETTWRLKPDLSWHDGVPFTADDLVFSIKVNRDRELEIVPLAALSLIDSVEAPDPSTIVVTWREPFIEADSIFSPGLVMPMARHVLEPTYVQDKSSLLTHPYWTTGFIGTGPYRMAEWVPSSHVTLTANEHYVFGRPRIDEIEVRFFTDLNTIIANLRAGSVEMLIGKNLPVEEALALREGAKNLNVVLAERLGGVVPMYTQHINTDPPIILNPEFRRALLRGINRQEMNETINYGIGPIAHAWLQPDRVEYRAVENRIVKYEYDPRQAADAMEGLGYTRGADGALRDPAGQRVHIEIRTTDQERIHAPSVLSVADYWKRLGIDVETNSVPTQRIADRAYRATFPAFELVTGGQSLSPTDFLRWRGTATPLPETQFQGANRTRYSNPAFDALIDRYVSTIPMSDRMTALGDFLHFQTDQLLILPLIYNATGNVLGTDRVKNVTSSKVWNAHLWDFA